MQTPFSYSQAAEKTAERVRQAEAKVFSPARVFLYVHRNKHRIASRLNRRKINNNNNIQRVLGGGGGHAVEGVFWILLI